MDFDMTSTVTQVAIHDLATGTVGQSSSIDVGHQMFCIGLSLLPDGKLLIAGGSSDSATTIYDPFTNTWTRGPLMTIPRAYQGNTLLSDGRVFTIGGSWHDAAGHKHGHEITRPSNSSGEAIGGKVKRAFRRAPVLVLVSANGAESYLTNRLSILKIVLSIEYSST